MPVSVDLLMWKMVIFYFYYQKINSTKKQQLQFLLPFVAFSRHITSFEVNISNMSYDGTNSSSPFFILCINNTHNAQRQRIKKPTKKWKPKSRFHHAIDVVLIFNKIKGKIFPTPFGYKLSRKWMFCQLDFDDERLRMPVVISLRIVCLIKGTIAFDFVLNYSRKSVCIVKRMFSQCDGELVHNEVILSANEKSFPSCKIEVSKPTRKIK